MARRNTSSGADVYLGANEARELVGAFRGDGRPLMGSDTQIFDYGAPQAALARKREEERWRRRREEGWRGRGRDQYRDDYANQWPYNQWQQPAQQWDWQQNWQRPAQPAQPQQWPPPQAPSQQWPYNTAPAPQGGVNVRDHRVSGYGRNYRRNAWNAMGTSIPFEQVEGLMASVEATPVVTSSEGAYGGLRPRAWLRNMPEPDMANRQVLPMNTGTTPVPIASTAQITSRPQRVAFRPERVFVSSSDIGGSGSAANWIINDITIGNRSQFAQSGALPGDMFSSVAIDSFVTFETAQTAMDVVMIVTYQGATEGGTPFYGSIIGTAAV